jgi:hypothetical protein
MGELAEERRAVSIALEAYEMYGWLWERDAGAQCEPVRSVYLAEVARSDIYIGLFWLGYGPYTIEEFDHAYKEKAKPFIYEKCTDVEQPDSQLQGFLERIGKVDNPDGLTICRFKTTEELARRVQKDVMGLLVKRFRQHQASLGHSAHADEQEMGHDARREPESSEVQARDHSIAFGRDNYGAVQQIESLILLSEAEQNIVINVNINVTITQNINLPEEGSPMPPEEMSSLSGLELLERILKLSSDLNKRYEHLRGNEP